MIKSFNFFKVLLIHGKRIDAVEREILVVLLYSEIKL